MKIIKEAQSEKDIQAKLATIEERRNEFHQCQCYDYVIGKLREKVEERKNVMSVPVDIENPEATTQIIILSQKLIKELEKIIEDL